MENPLEQFTIKKLIPYQINGWDFSFTNSALCMVVVTFFIVISMQFCLRKRNIVPNSTQAFSEAIYEFVASIVQEAMGKDGIKYISFAFSLFCFIACGNIFGLFPYSFTFTSHIAAVGTLSIFCLCTNIFFGIRRRGLEYFRTFFPHGIPLIMAPLIIPVEILSLLSKPFSLTIRLAVNMSVGHITLKILGAFIVTMGVFGIFPLAVDICIIMFEIFIGLLQAYIYTVLSCVYLGQAITKE